MDDPSAPYKPRRLASVQVARQEIAAGQAIYVLHNPETHAYIEIDEGNYFLWNLMDGEHELAAMAMAYLSEYGALPFDRLDALIPQLQQNYLLEGCSPPEGDASVKGDTPRLKRIADTAFQREFNWTGADAFFTRFYRRMGWIFYTRPALILMGLIATGGIASFVFMAWAGTYRLLRVNDSFGFGLLVLMLSSTFVLFWHESGHGLTCKSFGRSIRKAGLMFYYGNPAFFVDVSDMWLAPRRPRIWVSLAGPAVNVLVGSLAAIVAILLPTSLAGQVLFITAFAAYLNGFMNLNPLLELDGYYVLIDILAMPGLRPKSFAFLRRDLAGKIRRRERFSREEIKYSVFGLLAVAYTALVVLLTIYLWKRELQAMFQQLATGEDVLAALLVGVLALAAGAWLIVGLLARLAVWTGEKRQQRKAAMEGGQPEH